MEIQVVDGACETGLSQRGENGLTVSLEHDGSPPEVMRARIDALKDSLVAEFGANGADLPVEHVVVDGMYMRKLFVPKGTLLVGKIHLKSCMNIVASGDITVLTELGCARITAGSVGVSGRGIQKVGYAHEDTVFINIFRTDQVEIEAIEAEVSTEVHVPVELPHGGIIKAIQGG